MTAGRQRSGRPGVSANDPGAAARRLLDSAPPRPLGRSMGMFGWIGGLWRFLLGFGAVAPWLLLSFLLFAVGLILVLLGFDLDDVDRWIEAQGGWLDAVFSFLFRAASGLMMLICAVTVGSAIFDRKNPERPGVGCALLALVVSYFAWFGLTGG